MRLGLLNLQCIPSIIWEKSNRSAEAIDVSPEVSFDKWRNRFPQGKVFRRMGRGRMGGIRHGVVLDVRDRGGNRGPMFPQRVQWASFGTLRWIPLRLGRNLRHLESRSRGVISGPRSLGASDRNFQTAASQKQIRGMDADMKPARRNE